MNQDKIETSPAHESRMRRAKKEKEVVEIIDTWYEYSRGLTFDPKKGLKLVKKQRTLNGVSTIFVGWEKKMPKEFVDKLKKESLIRGDK